MAKLAIDGGKPVRTDPMPKRRLFGEEEKKAATAVFDEAIASGEAFGYNGPHEKEYEKSFCDYMGGGFADGVNSGTSAVFVALGALQLDRGSEVIVPPITDPGGVMPVVMLNCIPVIADSDHRSYNVGPEQISAVITENTKAIIVAHIAGDAVDMDPIMEIARSKNILVIEDCAQAHGAKYKGKLVGTIGDIAAFSTMFGKLHATGGQGGVVYSKNEELFWNAKRFADRGKPFNLPDAKGNVAAGLNLNLNELSAAIGVTQIKKLNSIISRRRKVAEAIKERLNKESEIVSMGWQVPETESVYWFMRIHVKTDMLKVDKMSFVEALKTEGISVTPSYRHIPSESPWWENTGPWEFCRQEYNKDFQCPNAISATDSHFNISLNENYGKKEIDDIVNALKKVEQAYKK
ncbi:MAG: DegT/DnrJ/EryC1/StrS family aminotransferase [bacterium]|nr:DegT/DnrJ/EryC1/StrS family aminotransferase [bacterium]